VHELYAATVETDTQLPLYLPGVGTIQSDDSGPLTRLIRTYGGGAFGGLNAKVKETYAFCAEHYEPCDEIMIFGFSRGAFTARTLAGMIRKSGFPDEVTRSTVNRAFWLYKQPGEHNGPDVPHILALRKTLSPRFATSDTDMAWRNDASVQIEISYLGIWDTVGALGVSTRLAGSLARIINFRHQFHDLELSSIIVSTRHTLALDEQRSFYPPSPWTNLNRLSTGKWFDKSASENAERLYQQMWFVGDHGMVGGSGKLQPLTAVTLAWIADGAVAAGLELKSDVAVPQVAPDPTVSGNIYSNEDLDPKNPGRRP